MELNGRRTRAERRGHRHRHLTLYTDSLPIEVHGAQPGSAWNGHYHQRMDHPIVAGIAETGDLLDARLRDGNAHTAESAPVSEPAAQPMTRKTGPIWPDTPKTRHHTKYTVLSRNSWG